MDKISIDHLMVEVTRRCNMECSHCLRGEAQNKNLSTEYIDKLLDQVDCIGEVTFTGGEPSLNVPMLEYFLEQVKLRGISVSFFYIATNGLKISQDFVMFCLKMYSYCDEKKMCCVDVSNDYYHAEHGNYNTELLGGLGFFNRKYAQECSKDHQLIAEGNSQYNLSAQPNHVSIIDDREDFNDSYIYLNCEGNIINGCDWSYSSQSQSKNILCPVENLNKYFYSLPN